eukprot:XP_001707567.1 Hypothetical protein GL50803_37664 [Giardia lamblia ATCC 50803]
MEMLILILKPAICIQASAHCTLRTRGNSSAPGSLWTVWCAGRNSLSFIL